MSGKMHDLEFSISQLPTKIVRRCSREFFNLSNAPFSPSGRIFRIARNSLMSVDVPDPSGYKKSPARDRIQNVAQQLRPRSSRERG